jgi:hypothetical protein
MRTVRNGGLACCGIVGVAVGTSDYIGAVLCAMAAIALLWIVHLAKH